MFESIPSSPCLVYGYALAIIASALCLCLIVPYSYVLEYLVIIKEAYKHSRRT